MLGEIAQYIVGNLAIAFVLGILVGYLIGRGKKDKFKTINKVNPDCCTSSDKRFKINPIFNKSASLDYKPMVLSSSSHKDNLKKIKGIDEELEAELYKLGIYHFNQIANWTNKNSEWIENFLNLPNYVRNNQWIEQAKILRTGKETNYSQQLLDVENSLEEEIK
ncbi:MULTISPECIES: hypothetical protein [Arcobacteraceae]|uniref:hypothetical protein n=1 Tax=Arcobacteraceae TaxID=2808963 RepID=UPI000DEA1128|nr:hypothetical protein [Arcobacter sp. CECT 9188]RBQ27096.1 hypothetical protein CRU88_00035 [Arcobacter sp. CECT 9188]